MRRYVLRLVITLASIIFIITSVQLSASTGSSLSKSRVNIILVMTDDQGYGDLSCHGNPILKTPNLDKLYGQSARFIDFHVSPTCAPTRSALMSGRAPFKNGITHTILQRDRMTLETTTIAQVLKKAGYTTGIFGKWHLGDEDEYQPHNRGFDETFIHGAGGIGQNYPGGQGAVPGTGYFNPIIKHNNKFEQTKGYCTDVFFKQALAWIKKCKGNKDKPFFVYLPTNAPHGPFIVDKKYSDVYKDVEGKGRNVANFFGMIANIDDNMAVLMQKLEEWDLVDDTLLIFMTDNGSARGSKVFNAGMKGAKGSVNEGGSRVPLFMRLPGKIKAGKDISRLTRHYDLFPTLTDIAGVKDLAKFNLDGRSLLPLLDNPETEWSDRYTFFHAGRWNKKGAAGHWGKGDTNPDNYKFKKFAVRNEEWRLVGKKLFNIDEDPLETKDVASEHPEVAAEMLKAYGKWWDEVRPLMVNEDAPLDIGKPFIEQFKKQKAAEGIPNWQEPVL
jgi:arylsulfatase A-like enzyme